jgi:hypothetical protein
MLSPFDTRQRLDLVAIVDDYVFGHILHAGELHARADITAEAAAAMTDFAYAQLRGGSFPYLTALASDPAARSIVDPAGLSDRFERGLQALLDGASAWSTSQG